MKFHSDISQSAELKLADLRKRCNSLVQLRSAWNNAYNSTLEALAEINTTEAHKTFAETFALTVLYKQITENQNNARN
jgi:hypothetical protein